MKRVTRGLLLLCICFTAKALCATAFLPEKWHCWPAKDSFTVLPGDSTRNEQPTWEFRLQHHSGHAGCTLPQYPDKVLSAFSFDIKALPENSRDGLEVMLVEADGERYFTVITLSPEWKHHHFACKDLRLYTYGGAKIADGTLAAKDIQQLRFNNYPAGRHFLLGNLKLEYAPLSSANENKTDDSQKLRPIEIDHIADPAPSPDRPKQWPIGIQNGQFTRLGKPCFLLGGWQADNESNPWLMRLLGVDLVTWNADEIYSLYPAKVTDSGALRVSWTETPWYEAFISRFTQNGILFWHEHKAHARYNALRFQPEFADLLDVGHFVPYDLKHPLGEQFYREMFKSWMRYTVKHPIFCYELFNEMGYRNLKPAARREFAQKMARKYVDIDKANAAWGTSFADFASVQPPGFIQDGGANSNLPRGPLFTREGQKHPNLLIDWLKFQEDDSYDMVSKLMPIMRSYDPEPRIFSTLQSHLNLFLDFCDTGMKPETLHDFSDFYSHEAPMSFTETDNPNNFRYVADSIRYLFFSDLVKGFSPDKPIINAESPFSVITRGAEQSDLIVDSLADLHAGWVFFDATAAEPANWFTSDFPDQQWKAIKVPEMWGRDGFPSCQVGLYRRHFKLSAKPQAGRPIFLNGKGFADAADIYLNGNKVGAVKGYDTGFTFDISEYLRENNSIAVRIVNRYFENGMFYGGIRGFVSINHERLKPTTTHPPEFRHLRSFLWSQAAHGSNGVSLCYAGNSFSPTARILPLVKSEIEAVADILFAPAKGHKPEVAMVWPQETLRGIIHKDYLEKITGPATIDLMPYYGALIFAGLEPDLIRQKDLCANATPYKLIVMPDNLRVSADALQALHDAVKAGATLLVNYGSLRVEDDFHQPINPASLTGLNENNFRSDGPRRFVDQFSGAGFDAGSATPFAEPEAMINHVGKGQVIYVDRKLSPERCTAILTAAAKIAGVQPRLQLLPLPGKPAPSFVDHRLFTSRQGDKLVYAMNFGAETEALLKINSTFPAAGYRLRNVAGQPEKHDRVLTPDDIAKGIPLRLKRFETIALLLEPTDLPKRPLGGISPTRLAMLDQLWQKSPEIPGQPRVGLLPIPGMENIHGTIPTARKILTDNGFNVIEINPDDSLADLDVLVYLSPRQKINDDARVIEFINNGGAVLYCSNAGLNYHCTPKNQKLLTALEIKEGNLFSILYNKHSSAMADNLSVACVDFAPHPISQGLREVVTAGSNVLLDYPSSATVVLKAPDSSNHPGKALVLAREFGKGRFVYCADSWFLRPLYLEKSDNARFWYNMICFLAGKTPAALSDEAIRKSLFISSATLAKAEEEEQKQLIEYRQPQNRESYLGLPGANKIQGSDSEDPIVDILTTP